MGFKMFKEQNRVTLNRKGNKNRIQADQGNSRVLQVLHNCIITYLHLTVLHFYKITTQYSLKMTKLAEYEK